METTVAMGTTGGAPPGFQTFAEDLSLDRGATHFALGLRPAIQRYLRPPLKITVLRPTTNDVHNALL